MHWFFSNLYFLFFVWGLYFWIKISKLYKKYESKKKIFYLIILVPLVLLWIFIYPPHNTNSIKKIDDDKVYSILLKLASQERKKLPIEPDEDDLPMLLSNNVVLLNMYVTSKKEIEYYFQLKKDNLKSMDEYFEMDTRCFIQDKICDKYYEFLQYWISFIYNYYDKDW
jgi:hypothetical protein